jgi:hypothetical protein
MTARPAYARPDQGRSAAANRRSRRQTAPPPAGSRQKPKICCNPSKNQATSQRRPKNTPRKTQPATRSGWACA